MIGKLRETLQSLDALGREKSLVVAVSGGADSTALLDMLTSAADPEFPAVTAAHLHHGLRGPESDRDAEFVAEYCSSRRIPLETGRLGELSTGPGNLEARARTARYDFLATLAAERGATVATAHTMEDQAETLLLRLFRGAGPGGLSGIRSQRFHRDPVSGRSVRVIRPLLQTSRNEVLEWLDHHGITYRTDSSNLDERFDRNWVRHSLLPMIRDRLNPGVAGVLASTASILGGLEQHISEEARSWLQTVGPRDGALPELNVVALRRLDPSMRRQVIREAFRQFQGDPGGLTFHHVEEIVRLASLQSGRRIDLPGEVRVFREFDVIRFVRTPPCRPFSYRLSMPGKLDIAEAGTSLRVERTPAGVVPSFRSTANEVTVRNRRPGDRVDVGRSHPTKLKDLLHQHRIPASERDRLILIESQGTIIWVEGLPSAGGEALDSPGPPGWSVKVFETFRR